MNVPQRRTELPWRLLSVFLAVMWMGAGLVCWTGCGQPGTPATPAKAGATSGEQLPNAEAAREAPGTPAARSVLNDMVAAYKKAASYSDMGYIELQYQLDGQPMSDTASYLVAVEQPNKFRVQSYAGLAVSDGEKLWAAVADEVIERDAPAEITIEKLCFDVMVCKNLHVCIEHLEILCVLRHKQGSSNIVFSGDDPIC